MLPCEECLPKASLHSWPDLALCMQWKLTLVQPTSMEAAVFDHGSI